MHKPTCHLFGGGPEENRYRPSIDVLFRSAAVSVDVIAESIIAETTAVSIESIEEIADANVFACPDCGGNLWTVKGDIIKRYRCHIGHANSERDLVVKQADTASTTLWMMEERKHLLKKIEVDHAKKGYKLLSVNNLEKQDEMERHIMELKKILFDLQNADIP